MERKSFPLHPLSPGLLPVTELFTFTTAQQRLIRREPISSPQACLTPSAPIRRCYPYSLSFFESHRSVVACFWGGEPDSEFRLSLDLSLPFTGMGKILKQHSAGETAAHRILGACYKRMENTVFLPSIDSVLLCCEKLYKESFSSLTASPSLTQDYQYGLLIHDCLAGGATLLTTTGQ